MKNNSKGINLICIYYILVVIIGTFQIIYLPKFYPKYLEDPGEIHYTYIRYALALMIVAFWVLNRNKQLFWLIIFENITNFYSMTYSFFYVLYSVVKHDLTLKILYSSNQGVIGFYFWNFLLFLISFLILYFVIKNFRKLTEI
jgi:hypothetical protein